MSRRKSKQTIYLSLERPFVGLPNETILSKELNSLSVHARWLYQVLLTRFDRRKEYANDWYPFTYEQLIKVVHSDRRTISASLRSLEDHGFIEIQHGGKNNPSLYRPMLKWLC